MQLFRKDRMWRHYELKPSYDVVIIGAGASGRNTAILRSNYRTPEGIPFYDASLKLYESMSKDLGWNVLFSQCGHLTLGHSDSSVAGLRVRAENNQLLGVNSRMISFEEVGKLVPSINIDREARYPILAALYH